MTSKPLPNGPFPALVLLPRRKATVDTSLFLKRAARQAFRLVGLELHAHRRSKRGDLVLFNRNYLSRYYDSGNSFRSLYNEGMHRTHSEDRDSFEKQCRYYGLYQMVCKILGENVAGEIAECGCWRGHSAYLIASLIAGSKSKRQLHVFDSFEGGLSDKVKEDQTQLATVDPAAVRREKEAFYSTEEEVSAALNSFEFVRLYKGWIPARFNEVSQKTFALVNLDLDLYEPIRDSLEFFFPRLSKGGVIVVDDYGTTEWPGVKKAVDQFLDANAVSFYLETIGSMIILK
jgi:O-methyltransferase